MVCCDGDGGWLVGDVDSGGSNGSADGESVDGVVQSGVGGIVFEHESAFYFHHFSNLWIKFWVNGDKIVYGCNQIFSFRHILLYFYLEDFAYICQVI